VIRNSWIGPHIVAATPWTDFGAFSWRDARYFEFHNIGPGAAASPDRPQLTSEQARSYEPDDYLTGADNWHPVFPG
jgi:pectinesterase